MGALQKKCPDGVTFPPFLGIIVVWQETAARKSLLRPQRSRDFSISSPSEGGEGTDKPRGDLRSSGDNARDPLASMCRTPSIPHHAETY